MTDTATPLKWLRRSLATFVGLLAVTVVCGLLWGLLSSMGDTVGSREFRRVTIAFAGLGGVSGIALLIGTAWGVTQLMKPSRDVE